MSDETPTAGSLEELLGTRLLFQAIDRFVDGPPGPGSDLARALARRQHGATICKELFSRLSTETDAEAKIRLGDILAHVACGHWARELHESYSVAWRDLIRREEPELRVAALCCIEALFQNSPDVTGFTGLDGARRAAKEALTDPSATVATEAERVLREWDELDALRRSRFEPALAGGHLDLDLTGLLDSGHPPDGLRFGMSREEALRALPESASVDGVRLRLAELSLVFEAEGLSRIELDYGARVSCRSSLLAESRQLLARGLTEEEVRTRLLRHWQPIPLSADGAGMRSEGGTILHFDEQRRFHLLSLNREDATGFVETDDELQTSLRLFQVDHHSVIDETANAARQQLEARYGIGQQDEHAGVLGLDTLDFDALATTPVMASSGGFDEAALVERLVGRDEIRAAAFRWIRAEPGGLLGWEYAKAVCGWPVVQEMVDLALHGPDGTDRRFAAVFVADCARRFASDRREELVSLVRPFLEDSDDGVRIFGGFGIVQNLWYQDALDLQRARELFGFVLRNSCINARENAAQMLAGLDWHETQGDAQAHHPFGPGPHRSFFGSHGLPALLAGGELPEVLWFPMSESDALELLGDPDVRDDALHYGELQLRFDKRDELAEVALDLSASREPDRSVLRHSDWFIRARMPRDEWLAVFKGIHPPVELMHDSGAHPITKGGVELELDASACLTGLRLTRRALAGR